MGDLRRGLLWGVSLTALALAAGPAMAQKKGGDAVLGVASPPPLTDAQASTAEASRNISMHWIETLFARDQQANPIPDLATGVDIAPDGLTYVFTLRQGVKFHNGQEMTSKDVKASLERYKKVGGAALTLNAVKEIEATDKYKVTLRLSSVFPSLIAVISAPGAPMAIYPESEGAAERGKVNHIGTGPYKFTEYRPDSHVKLTRFEEYSQNTNYQKRDGFGGKKTAYFDSVTVRFIPENGARAAALEAGEIHAIDNLPAPAARRLKSNPNVKIYEATPWNLNLIVFNVGDGPTREQKLRQAILYTLDMEEILAIAGDGLYQVNHAWQYAGTVHHAGDVGKEHYNVKDIPRAKRLLQESGYKGEEIVFLTDSTIKNHNDTAVVATEQLRKHLGLNIKLQVVDWPTAFNLRRQPTGWHMWTVGFGVEPYEGPVNVIGLSTKQNDGKGAQWMSDPVLEAADKLFNSSLKLEDQKKAVADWQRRMYEWVPVINTGVIGRYQAVVAKVEGYEPNRIPRMWDVWFK
jgi:peptide/nickel transport system substrate-binding protein